MDNCKSKIEKMISVCSGHYIIVHRFKVCIQNATELYFKITNEK